MAIHLMFIFFFFRPFGSCAEVLTTCTVENYFLPVIVSCIHTVVIPSKRQVSQFIEYCANQLRARF